MDWRLPGRRKPERNRLTAPAGWRALAPLHGVARPEPPVVSGRPFRLPAVAGTAPLLPQTAPHQPPPAPVVAVRATRRPATVPGEAAGGEVDADQVTVSTVPWLDDAGLRSVTSDDEPGLLDREPGVLDHEAAVLDHEPAVSEEPAPTAVVDDGLAGIIAMLDSEVQRSRMARGIEPELPTEPEVPTLYRPTLAESRRRGVEVGAAPDQADVAEDRPEEPVAATLPDSTGSSQPPDPMPGTSPPAPTAVGPGTDLPADGRQPRRPTRPTDFVADQPDAVAPVTPTRAAQEGAGPPATEPAAEPSTEPATRRDHPAAAVPAEHDGPPPEAVEFVDDAAGGEPPAGLGDLGPIAPSEEIDRTGLMSPAGEAPGRGADEADDAHIDRAPAGEPRPEAPPVTVADAIEAATGQAPPPSVASEPHPPEPEAPRRGAVGPEVTPPQEVDTAARGSLEDVGPDVPADRHDLPSPIVDSERDPVVLPAAETRRTPDVPDAPAEHVEPEQQAVERRPWPEEAVTFVEPRAEEGPGPAAEIPAGGEVVPEPVDTPAASSAARSEGDQGPEAVEEPRPSVTAFQPEASAGGPGLAAARESSEPPDSRPTGWAGALAPREAGSTRGRLDGAVDPGSAPSPPAAVTDPGGRDRQAQSPRAAERPTTPERATPAEQSTAAERAIPPEQPTAPERATPAERPAPAERAIPVERPAAAERAIPAELGAVIAAEPVARLEQVPAATVARFERVTGIDLGFVPVIRGSEVGRTAGHLDAAAFMANGAIHVPDTRGDLEHGDNETLLAHELTHIAQHRLSGAPLAGEVAAREAEAATVASYFGAEPPAGSLADALQDGALGSGTGLRWTPNEGFVSEAMPTAHEILKLSASAQQEDSGTKESPSAPLAEDEAESQPLAYPEAAEEPTEERSDKPAASPPATLTEQDLTAIAARVRSQIKVPKVDLSNPELLEGLAINLFDPLTRLLRNELIHDRERLGALTEFH